jgi:hypothetical protein
MPPPPLATFLIDDERFADQLEDLDPDVVEVPAVVPAAAVTPTKASIDSVDPSIWLRPLPSADVSASLDPVLFDFKKAPTLSDRLGVLAGPLAFVLLMIVGAAAAALVFRDRVAQIL